MKRTDKRMENLQNFANENKVAWESIIAYNDKEHKRMWKRFVKKYGYDELDTRFINWTIRTLAKAEKNGYKWTW